MFLQSETYFKTKQVFLRNFKKISSHQSINSKTFLLCKNCEQIFKYFVNQIGTLAWLIKFLCENKILSLPSSQFINLCESGGQVKCKKSEHFKRYFYLVTSIQASIPDNESFRQILHSTRCASSTTSTTYTSEGNLDDAAAVASSKPDGYEQPTPVPVVPPARWISNAKFCWKQLELSGNTNDAKTSAASSAANISG